MKMKKTEDIVCLVIDSGIFTHVARRLARDYARTFYWSPWETAFPKFKDAVIGDGYGDIERVESIWDVIPFCDLVVFTDIGMASLQKQLISMGKAVWECRDADELEARRGKFLEVLATTNLPVPKCDEVKGLKALKEYLSENPDRFIKVSTYRGDFETCHFRTMEEDEGMLDAWAVKLGPLRDEFTFYAFHPIDTEIEDGIDTYCIDGRWPETVIHGMEAKDSAYIGAFQSMAEVPEEVRIVNKEFGPVLAKYGYRSAFSTEVRITKEGESFFIDPTCRFPSPPSQVMCEMVGNLGEIMWLGANGILVEPEQVAAFGVQAIIKVDRDDWGIFIIPDELDQWFKMSFSCKVDGKICVPPDPAGVSEIGWLCAIGDTIEEAVESLREKKELLPEGCHCEFQSLADLLSEMEKAKESGMAMADQEIPDPSSIIG